MAKRKLSEYQNELFGRQCTKFERTLRDGTASPRKDGDIAAQTRRYAAGLAETRRLQVAAREVLMRYGVSRFGFIEYYRFVLHLGAMRKKCGGVDFEIVAKAAVGRWTGLGCEPQILREVLCAVFNLQLAIDDLPGQV